MLDGNFFLQASYYQLTHSLTKLTFAGHSASFFGPNLPHYYSIGYRDRLGAVHRTLFAECQTIFSQLLHSAVQA
jgi:hypothetical protein